MAPRDPRWVLGQRPSLGLIIGLVAAGTCALVSLSFDILNGEPVQFFIALALALTPVPLLLAGVLALDRMEPEPRTTLVLAFLWGAGVAVLAAGVLNGLNLAYLATQLTAAEARNVAATFGAPPVEETMKGLILLGLLKFRRHELNGPTDGIIYASMVGLGFGMAENVGYYIAVLDEHGVRTLAVTVVLRGFLSPFAHPLFTSLIGIAVVYAAQRRRAGRGWAVLGGWLGAMVLHGIWNGFVSYGGFGGLAVAYLLMMGLLMVELWIVFHDRRRIVGLLHPYLPQYIATGLIDAADIDMLSSLRERRLARQWAKAHGGRSGLAAMDTYQLAATELGMLHERYERGLAESPTAFAEQRDALLACLALARAGLPADGRYPATAAPEPPPEPGGPGR